MREIEARALHAFEEHFGAQPELLASAPGRVNLIGEHTDYNGGYVLPCAIGRRVAVAAGRGGGQVYSDDFQAEASLDGPSDGTWADYPRGVRWALLEAGLDVPAVRLAIAGDVPLGAGLSSSAAIECATAVALDALLGLGLDRKHLALLTQRAENGYVGVNSGIMDQYASLLCRTGEALFIDCLTLESEGVPCDLAAAGLSLVVCDTRVERKLAGTGYNERRAMTEEAARTLGVKFLRDVSMGDLDRLSGDVLRRARHVVSEDERVLEAVRDLRGRNFQAFGELMYASHDSLRDDYEVSVPQLDAFVETARRTGALGARLTGAGFGGCAIAIIARDRVEELQAATLNAYAKEGFTRPEFYTFEPSAGAEIVH